MQLLTLLVAVTALFLGDSRARAPAHVLSWRGLTVSSDSPRHSLRRLIHREIGAARNPPDATAAAKTPPAANQNPHGQ